MEKQIAKAIAAKRHRNRGGISLFSEKKENYDSDTADDTDPDQAKNKHREIIFGRSGCPGWIWSTNFIDRVFLYPGLT